MRTKLLVIAIFAFLLVSCTSSTESKTTFLSVTKNDSYLTVTNNSYKPVYITVFERKHAALINWAPSFDAPKISANSSININFNQISGLDTIKTGDRIIHIPSDWVNVYYWYKSDDTNPRINVQYIKL